MSSVVVKVGQRMAINMRDVREADRAAADKGARGVVEEAPER